MWPFSGEKKDAELEPVDRVTTDELRSIDEKLAQATARLKAETDRLAGMQPTDDELGRAFRESAPVDPEMLTSLESSTVRAHQRITELEKKVDLNHGFVDTVVEKLVHLRRRVSALEKPVIDEMIAKGKLQDEAICKANMPDNAALHYLVKEIGRWSSGRMKRMGHPDCSVSGMTALRDKLNEEHGELLDALIPYFEMLMDRGWSYSPSNMARLDAFRGAVTAEIADVMIVLIGLLAQMDTPVLGVLQSKLDEVKRRDNGEGKPLKG